MTAISTDLLIKNENLAVRELPADLETPVSVYLKLRDTGPSFLLESVTGGDQVARYSFIGIHPSRAFILIGNKMITESPADGKGAVLHSEIVAGPIEGLQHALHQAGIPCHPFYAGLPRFTGGLVGYLGYDIVHSLEPRVPQAPPSGYPDAVFLQADTLVAFDHAANRLVLLARGSSADEHLDGIQDKLNRAVDPALLHPVASPGYNYPDLQTNMSREQYMAAVSKAKEYISAGDIFQVVLSQQISRETSASAFAIYRCLRRLNPSPYMYFFDFTGLESLGSEPIRIIGASPEMHVRLEGQRASMHPIAGTRKRGLTSEEDLALEKELLADPKERAEHTMLVDLARNDLGRVCAYGSVDVTQYMAVERYSHVMHIVSHVIGVLRPGLDAFDLMRATFPAGTVSGAPKVRAMQIIAELENQPRGPYAGAVGYFAYDGTMDTCITIRTLLMRGQLVSVQAGAGIVADSDPENEYHETLNKGRALIVAVEKAEDGS